MRLVLRQSHGLYQPQYYFWQFRKDSFQQSLVRVNEMEQPLKSFVFLILISCL